MAGDFRAVAADVALRAAGMDGALRTTPFPEFSLSHGRSYVFSDGEVAQLVYRDGERAFSVFIAPHTAELDFGGRRTERVTMGDWECTQVESEELAVFWSVSRDRQSVMVARADDDFDVAAILRFFVYGEWDEES